MDSRPATETWHAHPSSPGVGRNGLLSTPNVPPPIRLLSGRHVLVGDRTPWQILDEIAAAQRNRASLQQLLGAGFTPQMLKTATRDHRLHRLHRGVFGVGAEVRIDLGRETAALLTNDGLALSGLSVLAAHGFVEGDPRRPVDVCRLGHHCASRAGIRVHRYGQLTRRDIRILRGLPMTTVERALLDAADELTGNDLEQAVDEAISAHGTSRTKLRETARAAPGRRGALELLRLADAGRSSAMTRGRYAKLALALIREANLPEPETEVRMLGFSMDFFFRDAGVVLEVDPYSIHGVIRANFNRDRRKARACRDAGLVLISVTGDDLTVAPLAFISDLAQTIARRTASERRAV